MRSLNNAGGGELIGTSERELQQGSELPHPEASIPITQRVLDTLSGAGDDNITQQQQQQQQQDAQKKLMPDSRGHHSTSSSSGAQREPNAASAPDPPFRWIEHKGTNMHFRPHAILPYRKCLLLHNRAPGPRLIIIWTIRNVSTAQLTGF